MKQQSVLPCKINHLQGESVTSHSSGNRTSTFGLLILILLRLSKFGEKFCLYIEIAYTNVINSVRIPTKSTGLIHRVFISYINSYYLLTALCKWLTESPPHQTQTPGNSDFGGSMLTYTNVWSALLAIIQWLWALISSSSCLITHQPNTASSKDKNNNNI